MTVQAANFKKGLQQSSMMLKGFQGEIQRTSSLMSGLFVATGLSAATAGIYKLVKAGSDLIENQNKVRAVFGQNADVVLKASEDMAGAFGTSRSEFQDAAGVFGAIFKNIGYDSNATAQLSVQMVKLASDLASFKNIGFDDALQKIRAGLTGESEPLKAIGVLINEDAVKTEAYRMKIARMGQELTEQQKVQARLSLITKQTADAQGDLAKTADDVANATRGFTGRIQNLAETIGTALQPVAKAVFGELSLAVSAAEIAWDEYAESAVGAGAVTDQAVQQQTQSIGWLQKAVGFIADEWKVVTLGFSAAQSYMTAGLGKLVEGLASLAKAFESLPFVDIGHNASAFLEGVASDLKNLSDTQWEGFQDKLREPWPSESVNEYFNTAKLRTKELRDELGKTGINPNQFKPTPGKTKPGEIKFASAEERGSSGAVNTILRSRFGTGKGNKAAEQTAENTKKTAELLQTLVGASIVQSPLNVIGNF